MAPRTKVLFIAGWGRSGSTIMASLLGQLEGFFSAGEVRYLWDRGLLRNRTCGCGRPFRECPAWSRVVANLAGKPAGELEAIVALRDQLKTRHCLPTPDRRATAVLHARLTAYAEHMGDVYAGLRAALAPRVVIDSSKFPIHGLVLDRVPDLDLYVLHLVRDPRAVAHSWKRKRIYEQRPSGEAPQYMRRYQAVHSTLHWMLTNLVTERLWRDRRAAGRYMRLRYEDFVRFPRESVIAIQDMLGETAPVDFFTAPDEVRLAPTHALAGNPSRFETGAVRIIGDEEWRRALPPGERAALSALSAPLLLRYGYLPTGPPLRP